MFDSRFYGVSISESVRTLCDAQAKRNAERSQNIFETRYGRFYALFVTIIG